MMMMMIDSIVIIFFNHCHLVVAAPIHSTLEGKVVLAEAFEYNVDGDFDDDDDANANGDCLCKFWYNDGDVDDDHKFGKTWSNISQGGHTSLSTSGVNVNLDKYQM